MDSVVEQNNRLIELLKLDVRIYLMFALVLISMMGLVLLLFTSVGARHLRRRRFQRQRPNVDLDDWARRPLMPKVTGRPDRWPSQPEGDSSTDHHDQTGGGP